MGEYMGGDIRYISLFSGVEACSVAWYHMKNWKAQVFAEFDEFPSAVLKHQFPHVPNVGDVTKHDWKQYRERIELVVGGSPCQSFSAAGQRLGLDDPRGNLALHFLRVIDDIRPTWFIFENVPGILSSDNGRDFATFLAEVENIGYGCAYRVLDAQHFGVPQRRRRLFVVGHIDGDYRRSAAVLFEPNSLSRDSPQSREEGQAATSQIGGSTTQRGEYWNGERIANTLTARADAQRMPDKDHFNGVIVPTVYENHGQDSRIKEVNVAPTLPARAGTGGNNLPIVKHTQNVVRRLTPVECERLQGFPDNWTQIPWKGKPKEDCPDGHRFKAMGNSMAVPVMRWIGEGIELVNRIARTKAPQQEELGWL